MTLALVRCNLKADQGGILYARTRVNLVILKEECHAVLFMVPLGPPGVTPMAEVLWLPFEYYYITIFLEWSNTFDGCSSKRTQ